MDISRIMVILDFKKTWSTLKKNRLPIVLCLLAIIVGSLILLTPYIIRDPFFEVGFDTGVYERTMNIYHNSNNWRDRLPAYPPTAEYDSQWMNKMEPGMFIVYGMAYEFSNLSVNELFRWILPIVMSILFVVVAFTIGRNLTGSDWGGGLAAFIIVTMNLQYESINEAYYKQFIAIALILISLYAMDVGIKNDDHRYLIASGLTTGGTYYYHLATAFTIFLFVLIMIIIHLIMKKKNLVKKYGKIFFLAIFTTLPASIPMFQNNIKLLSFAYEESTVRMGMIGTDAGTWYSGGSIPYALWDFQHILIGYTVVFLPFVILSLIGAVYLIKKREETHLIWLAVVLATYIGMWLYFGNRMIFEFDAIIALLASAGLFFIIKYLYNKKPKSIKIIAAAVVILLIINVHVAYSFQSEKKPYINDNIEGVAWIQENISIEDSIIFAPDYLSANLIQMGYRMAIWDYSLPLNGEHPIDYAESFILYSPGNETYCEGFFNNHTSIVGLNIYVLWGELDHTRPLIYADQIIPFYKYEIADNYVLKYEGEAEILMIYQYVWPS